MNIKEEVEKITFSEPIVDRRINWQEIIYNGKVIGASAETMPHHWSIPIETFYQKLVTEEKAIELYEKGIAFGWYNSEDVGYAFAQFEELETLLEVYLQLDNKDVWQEVG